MRAQSREVSRSASDRPTKTAERHMGRARRRSITPSWRSVLRPTAVPMVEEMRLRAKMPASTQST
jgi:hypothetical protein